MPQAYSRQFMKIYFAGSIRGGRDDRELYSRIIKLLSGYGAVLTEHVGNKNLSAMGQGMASEYIHKRDVAWLKEANVLVAEVTTPSLGVGYEIAKAEEMNKKILCLYRPAPDRKLSAMIAGSGKLITKEYNSESELGELLRTFFKG